MYKKTLCFYLIVCAISLVSCNTTNLISNSDPLELLNRKIFRANDTVDQTVLRPVSFFYRESTPQLLQNDIENFLQWLDTPNALVNNLLQGNFNQAETTLKYFFLQSFHLGHVDLNFQNDDFGQTLGSFCVQPGPYLVLPLLGPTNVRDSIGRAIDVFLNPFNYVGTEGSRTIFSATRGSFEALTFRTKYSSQIDELRENSIDYYARVKTIYNQRRNASINNKMTENSPETTESIDAFDDQFLKLLD
jgi:phospholipid-binding lipoprotein MlaA